jgi:hypothetical protein
MHQPAPVGDKHRGFVGFFLCAVGVLVEFAAVHGVGHGGGSFALMFLHARLFYNMPACANGNKNTSGGGWCRLIDWRYAMACMPLV